MKKKHVMLIAVLIASSLILFSCSDKSEQANKNESNEEKTGDNEQEVNNEDSNNDSNQDNGEENESDLDNEQNDEETDSELNDDQSSNDETNDDEATNTDASDSTSSDVSSNDNDGLPDTIKIDEEVQDAGVTLTLEDITFKDNHIAVSFHASNTRGHGVKLAGEGRAEGDNLGGITLIDDTGYEYRYIADVGDHRIQLFDGEEVTGNISFAGKIQADAKSLTLVFNPDESDSEEKPEFSFEDIEIKR